MDPITIASLAAMAAGAGSQAKQLSDASDARMTSWSRQASLRDAQRQKQQGYTNETMALARGQLAGFNPASWQAREDASFNKLAPQWTANAEGAQSAPGSFAGQSSGPQFIADQLAKQLVAARDYGKQRALSRARMAAAEDQDFGIKADAAKTAAQIAAVNDFAAANDRQFQTEHTVAGIVPQSQGGLGDLLVGTGSLGLAARAGGLVGGPAATVPRFDRIMAGRGY